MCFLRRTVSFLCGRRISVDDFSEMIRKQFRPVILDVRSADEFNEGHVRGALHIPDYKIAEEIESKVPDKKTPVYIYCYSGARAGSAARQMRHLGYEEVHNMGGIMYAGFTEAFPLEK